MQISFNGVKDTIITLIKLFFVGLIVYVLFHIAIGLLPFIILGLITVYAIDYFKKDEGIVESK